MALLSMFQRMGQHPRQALAFGVPHPMWGEEVNAAVVLREPTTEAAILAFCKERLADFKMPKKLFVVESIPRTATGKVQKFRMREQAIHDLGLGAAAEIKTA